MKELTVSPETFAEIARSVAGDARGAYRVGETICVRTEGSEVELHLHISFLTVAPDAGGKGVFGITILPFDVRWNRLWTLAQKEPPMFRAWLWELMKATNAQVDEEHFLAAQYSEGEPHANPMTPVVRKR